MADSVSYNGLTITPGEDMTRIHVACEHQQGLIYVVPAERSWVCDSEYLPAHALAGFFRELVGLRSTEVQQLMKEWGVYYRQTPRTIEQTSDQTENAPENSTA